MVTPPWFLNSLHFLEGGIENFSNEFVVGHK